MKTLTSALAIAALFAAPLAYAGEEEHKAADADQSGGVSWDEAAAANPDMTEEDFTAADADASGELDQEEFDAAMGGN